MLAFAFQACQSLFTHLLYQSVQVFGALHEPVQRPFADLVVFGITGFDVSLVEHVEPGVIAVLVTLPSVNQASIAFLGEHAEEFQIMRGRAVIRQHQQHCCVSLFNRLVKQKCGFFIIVFSLIKSGAFQKIVGNLKALIVLL